MDDDVMEYQLEELEEEIKELKKFKNKAVSLIRKLNIMNEDDMHKAIHDLHMLVKSL